MKNMKIHRARKSSDMKRTETIAIRVSPSERELLSKSAEKEHDYPSNYLRKIFLNHVEGNRDVGNMGTHNTDKKILENV